MHKIALKYLPLLGLAAIALEITYVCGYFRLASLAWITMLSVADVFSFIWVVLPAVLIFSILFMPMAYLLGVESARRHKIGGENSLPESPVRVGFLRWLWIDLSVLVFFGGILFPVELFRNLAFVPACAVVASTFGMQCWIYKFREAPYREIMGMVVSISSVFALTYTGGTVIVSFPFLGVPNSWVVAADGKAECVGIIAILQKGILYTPDRAASKFVQWEGVRSVSTNSPPCSKGKP